MYKRILVPLSTARRGKSVAHCRISGQLLGADIELILVVSKPVEEIPKS